MNTKIIKALELAEDSLSRIHDFAADPDVMPSKARKAAFNHSSPQILNRIREGLTLAKAEPETNAALLAALKRVMEHVHIDGTIDLYEGEWQEATQQARELIAGK